MPSSAWARTRRRPRRVEKRDSWTFRIHRLGGVVEDGEGEEGDEEGRARGGGGEREKEGDGEWIGVDGGEGENEVMWEVGRAGFARRLMTSSKYVAATAEQVHDTSTAVSPVG